MGTRYRSVMWLFFAVVLLHLSAGMVLAGDVVRPRSVETGYVIVTVDSADVREGPSAKFAVIEQVERDEVIPKLGRTGRWYYVQIDEDSFGWISGRDIARYREPQAFEEEPYEPRYYDSYYYNYYGTPYPVGPRVYWEWDYYDRGPHRGYDRDRYRDRDRRGERGRNRDRGPGVEIRPLRPVVPPGMRRLPVPPVPFPVPKR